MENSKESPILPPFRIVRNYNKIQKSKNFKERKSLSISKIKEKNP